MSLRKGDRAKRGQRHKNSTGFKPGLHDGQTKQLKEAVSRPLPDLCERCRLKIEWKKQYGKYKPLTVPRKCILCQEKRVRQAYYQICRECAVGNHQCAKCGERYKDKLTSQAEDGASCDSELSDQSGCSGHVTDATLVEEATVTTS